MYAKTSMIQSFLDLDVYKEALDLAEEVEQLVRKFPPHEKYQLCDQMRRASRAVPALIAESWSKRKTIKSFKKYLKDAIGESDEMITHLELARRFDYLPFDRAKKIIESYNNLSARINQLKNNWRNYA